MGDVVALGAFGPEPGVVEVGTEVVDLSVGVGQQRPDDRQDGTTHCYESALLAAAPGDPPVALTEREDDVVFGEILCAEVVDDVRGERRATPP